MLKLAVLSLLYTCAKSTEFHPLSDEFIEEINKRATTWQAGRNYHEDTPINFLSDILGVNESLSDETLALPYIDELFLLEDGSEIPRSFDARQKWPACPSIKEIRNQGACGSCWAFGAVEAMSDRICIHSNGKKNFHFSADDLLSCCTYCGHGCNGGSPGMAWLYWKQQGIVSGGPYGTKNGCRPYEISPCQPSRYGRRCRQQRTPRCSQRCVRNYKVPYNQDKHFGKSAYRMRNNEAVIRREIMQNGPVEASFQVYEDFYHYKRGVYQHVMGRKKGGHAIRILGWGEERGVPYWLIANSWAASWGDRGFFKFIRGHNHLGMEQGVVAGMPRY